MHRVPSGGSLGWTADVQERSPRLDAAQQLLGDFQQLASGGFQRLASDPSSLLGGVASLFHSPADSGDNRNEHAEPAQTSRPEDESAIKAAIAWAALAGALIDLRNDRPSPPSSLPRQEPGPAGPFTWQTDDAAYWHLLTTRQQCNV